VFFVNLPVCAVVIVCALKLLAPEPRPKVEAIDVPGAILPTAGALTLVYALVNAPDTGWGSLRTIVELAAAAALLVAFVVNENRRSNPLFPLSILRVPGLAAADATQVIAQAAFYSLFFFITLYMQDVLGLSPIQAGAAYIPVTIAVGISSGVSTKLLPRVGSRPLIVAGTLIGAAGVFWLSRIPANGSYVADVLPGLVVMALGLGAVFVGVQTAANAGVPAEQAGLAAALISASSTLGGALGLAIFSAIATSRTHDLLAAHASGHVALASGFGRALTACSLFLLAAAVIAARTRTTHGQAAPRFEPVSVAEAA
jgi:predicted MFS family arabinose efflux permease